ncbi:hypothetical protein [Microbacterium sp. No. 7]|uniref:hypothetical protein n=1 Tax=Microbacterium sp. No. 7 TaxID=1714373 RepID=UPI000A879496|nr:hypothetical protein [Microbacterium sp. No. 7]
MLGGMVFGKFAVGIFVSPPTSVVATELDAGVVTLSCAPGGGRNCGHIDFTHEGRVSHGDGILCS